jgi:hypothetical protein
MKYHNNGSFYTVAIPASEVREWARAWPCFGTVRPLWFQFDRKSGDLVDMANADGIDDSAALALSHDCQAWAHAHEYAAANQRKTVRVDVCPIYGTRYDQAIFSYRGNRVCTDLTNPMHVDIRRKLAQLQQTQQFTHWHDEKTGQIRLIVQVSE